MKIESSELLLQSTHQLSRKKEIKESLVEGFSRAGENWSEDNLQQSISSKRHEVKLYDQYGWVSTNKIVPAAIPKTAINSPVAMNPVMTESISLQHPSPDFSINSSEQLETDINPQQLSARLLLMVTLIEAMTGKKINFIDSNSIQKINNASVTNNTPAETTTENTAVSEYGSRYEYSETTTETESTQFQTQGKIQTADGKEIIIDLSINMSRSFTEHFQININEGAAIVKDPLVINFTGNSTQLSNEKIQFDIDADGINDNISFVTPDSGFLALDKNNDGLINNGSELFGALSGNGFADLAQYDTDQNNFIDENDSVFNLLKVWVKDANGNDTLYTLKEANVGAIYLESASTPFELKNSNNELLGAIKSTGVYLTEDGDTKTVQQLDLVV